jgi:hypothetical protein
VSRTIETKYWLGDVVYLRVNDECKPGMVTGVNIRPSGTLYAVTWRGGSENLHFELELTGEYVPDFGTYDAGKEASS